MACQVQRTKGIIQKVLAPNLKESMAYESLLRIVDNAPNKQVFQDKFSSWVGKHITNTADNKELALALYKQLYSPMFKDWFGQWEPLANAVAQKKDINGFYSFLFDQDPQQVLFEASMQANSSQSEKDGAIKIFGEPIVKIAQDLFPTAKVGDTYKPIIGITDINGEPLLTNDQYTNSNGNNRNILNRSSNNPQYQLTGSSTETIPSRASTKTIALVKEFLNRIGVKLEPVTNIVVDGQKIGSNGTADAMNKLVQVVIGKEDVALTEEAFHVAVELIAQKNPSLLSEMMNKISKYNMYDKVLEEYRDTYVTAEGKPDIARIKKETIAKILAEMFVRENSEVTEKPEFLAQTQTWWEKVVAWLKGLFIKADMNIFKEDPFETAIGVIKDKELTPEDANNLNSKRYLQTRASPEEVEYQFKAATKIFDNIKKVETWEKQIKDEEQLFKKIQNDLQIPKDQLQLIRDNYNGDIKEAVNSMVADMAFTVEVKKGTSGPAGLDERFYMQETYYFEEDGRYFVEHLGADIEEFVNKEAYERSKARYKEQLEHIKDEERGSSYYEHLTVPGGTNYEEHDIRVPGVSPIISSHAEFANDNSIGWFRSDTEVKLNRSLVGSGGVAELQEFIGTPVTPNEQTNTRRILEMQSDAFQKGRERSDLTKEKQRTPQSDAEDLKELNDYRQELVRSRLELDRMGRDDLASQVSERLARVDNQIQELSVPFKSSKENKFLQLLNKEGNWIGFFIKTIMQNSVRNGYDNVRFPAGDTASKVEGHQTLASQIKAIDESLGSLQRELGNFNKPDVEREPFYKFEDVSTKNEIETGGGAINEDEYVTWGYRKQANGLWVEYMDPEPTTPLINANKRYTDEELLVQLNKEFNQERRRNEGIRTREDITSSIERLEAQKQNLKDNGIAKLKPIYAFYEERVRNTLANIYGKNNVIRVTDEHGNDWFEVKTDAQRDKTIYFQKTNEKPEVKLPRMDKSISQDEDGNFEVGGRKVTSVQQMLAKEKEAKKSARFEERSSEAYKADRAFKRATEGAIKEDIHDILGRYINEDGSLRDTPLQKTSESRIKPGDDSFYEHLETNLLERIATYDPLKTKFFHNINIYSEGSKLATNVDFIAVRDNGKVDVLQFKAPDVRGTTDISHYIQAAYSKEMEEIKRILENGYGIRKGDFNHTRTIPIIADYSKAIPGSPLNEINDLRIGNVNVNLITSDILLPIPSVSEKTGNVKFDDLVSKLRGLLKRVIDRRDPNVSPVDRSYTIETLQRSIKKLQIQKNTTALISSAKLLNLRQEDRITRLTKAVDELDPEQATIAQMSKMASQIMEDWEESEIYAHMDDALQEIFTGGTPEEQEILAQAAAVSLKSRALSGQFLKLAVELQTRKYAAKVGIRDEFLPEKQLTWYRRMVRSLSQSHTTAGKLLWKLVDRQNESFHIQFQGRLNDLQELHKNVMKWLGGRNIETLYHKIFRFDEKGNWKGEVVKKYDSQFYKDLYSAQETGNITWVRDNIDMKAYDKWFKEMWQQRADEVKSVRWHENEEDHKRIVKEKMDSWYNIFNPEKGFVNKSNYKLQDFPLDKHFSKEYNELLKPENEPVLKLYNHWRNRLEESVNNGMIDEHNGWAWFPNVRRNLIEKMTTAKAGGKFKDFLLGSTLIDTEDLDFGKIDPINKKPINEIHANYVHDLGEKVKDTDGKYWTNYDAKSMDIFKVLGLWDREILKYNLKTESEGLAKMLLFTEQNRRSLQKATTEKPIKDTETGELGIDPSNEENAKYLQEHLEAVYYGKVTENSSAFTFELPIKKIAEKINSLFGRQLVAVPEKESVQISGVKALGFLNRWMVFKTLGVNVLSPLANLFGGTFNAFLNSGRFFDKQDFLKAQADLTSARFWDGDRYKKLAGFLAYIQPYTEDKSVEATRHLSVSLAVRQFSSDWLMGMMRASDKGVNMHIAIAFINNAMVRNGKILNIREVAREELDHSKKYSGSNEDTKAWTIAWEKRVEELKSSPEALLNVMSIKDDKVEIPGIDLHNTKDTPQTVQDFRSLMIQTAQDALGNTNKEDLSLYKRSMIYQSVAMFKNWIPRMVDVRGQSLRYNAGTNQYEWGRVRMLGTAILNMGFASIAGLFKSLGGNTSSLIEAGRAEYQKKIEQREKAHEDFDMTEAEFIDMYVKGVSTQFKELGLALAFIGMLIAARLYSPDSDDSATQKGAYKWMLRGLDKLQDEVSFFYNPQSFSDIINGSIFPAASLVLDANRFLDAVVAKGFYEYILGDDQRAGKQHPTKYLMRMFPITKELLNYMAIMDSDLAKQWDLRVSSRNGSSR